jgi:peptide deformylase
VRVFERIEVKKTAMQKIVQNGDPVLRKRAREVPVKEIVSPKIKNIISKMKEALESQKDGVAIAAPQIGEDLRIFVISGNVFDPRFKRGEKIPETRKKKDADMVFINPKFLKMSKKTAWLEEGCLSVRWLYGEVKRSLNAKVEAYDEKGKKFERGGGGIIAHIFQHEIDHLDGILFIDKAKNIRENLPIE